MRMASYLGTNELENNEILIQYAGFGLSINNDNGLHMFESSPLNIDRTRC